jgi:hypothetical protein
MTSKLREISNVRQVPGELRRRWFTSETMDLIVWVDDTDMPVQLQFCYDKGRRRAERAFTWKPERGFTHQSVDDGESENSGRSYKATPLLVTDSSFNTERVCSLFVNGSEQLPSHIIDFVTAKIHEYQSAALQYLAQQNTATNSTSQNLNNPA